MRAPIIRSSINNTQREFRTEFTIKEGKLEEYKKLVQDMSKAVEANEPDTPNYQFYLNRDETKCIVHVTYRNSGRTSPKCQHSITNNTSKDFEYYNR